MFAITTPTIPSTNILSGEDWLDDLEPGYESVRNRLLAGAEPDYEKVRSDSDDPGYEKIKRKPQDELDEPTYESVKHGVSVPTSRVNQNLDELQNSNETFAKNVENTLDDSDPGYESVKKIERSDSDADPGYEAVKRQHEEPDYESVTPKLSEKVNGFSETHNIRSSALHPCDESEPGYERVRCSGASVEEEEDPNYERLHQVESDMDPDYETVGQHSEEPGYEKVKHQGSDNSDPNYERIDRVECDGIEPGYETVKYLSDDDNDSDNTGKIQVSHPPRVDHAAKQLNSSHIEVSIYSTCSRTYNHSQFCTNSEVEIITNTTGCTNVEQNDATGVTDGEVLQHDPYTNDCKDLEENTSL